MSIEVITNFSLQKCTERLKLATRRDRIFPKQECNKTQLKNRFQDLASIQIHSSAIATYRIASLLAFASENKHSPPLEVQVGHAEATSQHSHLWIQVATAPSFALCRLVALYRGTAGRGEAKPSSHPGVLSMKSRHTKLH